MNIHTVVNVSGRAAAAAAAFALVSAEAAGAPPVEEIVRRAEAAAYRQGDDGRARATMTIVDAQGRERVREFTILRKNLPQSDRGEQRYYVLFSRPADVNRTAFLVWKRTDRDDDRWLYLPGLDLVKRIAASDERTSFVGSHFFYEDVSGRNPDEDRHVLAEETGDAYVVESTPRNPGQVEFARYRTTIDKGTFVPMRTEYLDAQGQVYRVYTALKVAQVKGYPTVMESRMEDRRLGGTTTLRYASVDYDLGLPDDLFAERYLRTPPRQYLR